LHFGNRGRGNDGVIISSLDNTTIVMAATTTPKTGKDAAKIEGIYVSRHSAAPIESKETARLIPGKGIEGDRYALGTGTYSAKFMSEPGKNLTMVSLEGITEATERTGMTPFDKDNIGDYRRNIVLSGISAQALNNMVGHEVQIGKICRVFVHRRSVPCKYREGASKRPGLMNNLWGVSGVNCEVLSPPNDETNDEKYEAEAYDYEIKVGDAVATIPNTYQPDRIDIGRKPPGFFIRPADRTVQDVQKMIKRPYIALIACLIDPEGFQRVESAYNSVGQRFWTPDAYAVGLLFKSIRIPLLATVSVALLSIGMAVGLHLAGIEF